MQKPFESSFFWTGDNLPDILYEHLYIDKDIWQQMDLDTSHKFNLGMMGNKREKNYLKKIPNITFSVNTSVHQAFESSVPSQKFV